VKPLTTFLVVVAAAAVLGGPATAAAQSGPGRPYRALFGGATTDPSMHKALDVTFSVAEAYDDNVQGESDPLALASPLLRSGWYTSLAPAITYTWAGRHAVFNSSAGSNLRYYSKEGGFFGSTHFGGVGFSSKIGNGQLAASQSVSYSPSYFYGLLPSLAPVESGVPVGAVSDFTINDQKALLYDSAVTFNQALSRRTSVSLLANYQTTKFSDDSMNRDLRSYSAGGRYGYTLSKNATLHLGYVYRTGQYSYTQNGASTVVHDIDAGVDYHRPLSLSRRTRFDFTVGSAIVNADAGQGVGSVRQFRLVGTAALSHDMGRTWRAKAAYNRGAGFPGGFNQAVFSDAVIASLDGFLSRRVDFHAGGNFSAGDVTGTAATSGHFQQYSGSTRLRAAVTTVLAVFGEYTYYNYDLGSAVATAPGVPLALERSSVRLGLSVWLPLVRQ
jgi:hypothetical protein